MILEDFVMLGTTVPEPSKSTGRVFVCSAGVSTEDRRLVRIYPLARRNIPHRWHMYRVALERNSQDSRDESFKVAGDRSRGAHERINHEFEQVKPEIPKSHRLDLLLRHIVGSIQEANERRLSLAVIQPTDMSIEFDHIPPEPERDQLILFDDGTDNGSGARRFPWMPRIRFTDAGGEHRLMLRDWGTFERMRKEDGFDSWTDEQRRDHITRALHLDSNSSLFVGNMNNQRTAWLVISVLGGLRSNTDTLFELS